MFATYDINNGSNRHGVGLGLTIANKLAKELGPTDCIDVKSEVGVGSCFSFKIFV
jgi:signal transduction histidine kinase